MCLFMKNRVYSDAKLQKKNGIHKCAFRFVVCSGKLPAYLGRLKTVEISVICASDMPVGTKPMLRAHM